MARFALYTRVSTEDQAKEGFSMDAQIEKLRAYASIRDGTVGGEYADEGESGRTTKRPAYQRMMAEMDQWDALVVMKMDRIHRNSRNFTEMMDELKKHGKEFISVTESFDTSTAMGRFVMDIVQRIAQLESDQTGERVLVGMRQKAKTKAGGLGGPAPFGYEWHEGVLRPVAAEAPIVRSIFSLHKGGNGYGEIAEILNARGERTRSGNPWSYWNVRDIHRNKTYLGHLEWAHIVQKNAHEPLVEA